MADISAAAVAALRARTGVSILECKKALEEANGDQEKAIEILRKKGIASAAKKADRAQSEGSVFLVSSDGKAALVIIKCETDFVARDSNFQETGKALAQLLHDKGEADMKTKAEEVIPALVQKLGENIGIGDMHVFTAPVIGSYVHSNAKIGVIVGLDAGTSEMARDVAMHAAAMNPSFVKPEDVSEELLVKEREIWKSQLAQEGKPEAMLEKIMMGKEKKFREENALTKQAFVKDNTKTVEAFLAPAKVVEFIRVSIA